MAGNSWNETIADVNRTLANMNTAISDANGAATSAGEAQEEAEEQAGAALAAATAANSAAEDASEEAVKWKNATASAETLAPGSAATVTITEKDGAKHFTIGVPRGADGEKGATGAMGKSGVTFRLSGSILTIATE